MDDGDIEHSDTLSDNAQCSNPESSCNFQASTSIDTINESLRNTRKCTHNHTCNPPGPEAVHAHICYHTHTQVFASEEDDMKHTNSKPRRPSGNREAVRKYREKKKAQTAYLEEEVKKLHLQNQQLVRRLQRQAILEAELRRLRSILVDLKRKTDKELGVFPYKKQCMSSVFDKGDAGRASGLHCQTKLSCFGPHAGSSSQVGNGKLIAQGERNCQFSIVDCQVNIDKKPSIEEETVG